MKSNAKIFKKVFFLIGTHVSCVLITCNTCDKYKIFSYSDESLDDDSLVK